MFRRLLFVMSFFIASSAFAGFDEGIAAYNKKDYSTALKEWLPLAEQGQANAQFNIGYLYVNGQGVQKDDAVAVKWYRLAAEQGLDNAQYMLGYMYDAGNGVQKDYVEALNWYLKAADQKNSNAQLNIGVMYANGHGVTKDYAEAIKWFRLAADQGEILAQNNLGSFYLKGQGVAQDYVQAVYWYRKSAEQGNPVGQQMLGALYADGNGVEKNFEQAMFWLSKSVKQGNTFAQAQLNMVTELIKNEQAAAEKFKACVKTSSTEIFGEALNCTTQSRLRNALKNNGLQATREDDGYWYDQYDSSGVLEDTSGFFVAYIKGQFARASYKFDSSMDTGKVVEVRKMIESKYGKPATSSGNPTLGEVEYSWKLKDGIKIEVTRGWPDTTVYLTYIHPKNDAAMEAEKLKQKQAEEAEKRNKQNKAF